MAYLTSSMNSAEYWYWVDVDEAADEVDWIIEWYGYVTGLELREIAEEYDICLEDLMYECCL